MDNGRSAAQRAKVHFAAVERRRCECEKKVPQWANHIPESLREAWRYECNLNRRQTAFVGDAITGLPSRDEGLRWLGQRKAYLATPLALAILERLATTLTPRHWKKIAASNILGSTLYSGVTDIVAEYELSKGSTKNDQLKALSDVKATSRAFTSALKAAGLGSLTLGVLVTENEADYLRDQFGPNAGMGGQKALSLIPPLASLVDRVAMSAKRLQQQSGMPQLSQRNPRRAFVVGRLLEMFSYLNQNPTPHTLIASVASAAIDETVDEKAVSARMRDLQKAGKLPS